ncbi:MAG: hypothetical protein ABFD08_15275 [Syntrophomonas sp.]
MADINAIADAIIAKRNAMNTTSSLIPSTQTTDFSSLVPSQPTYTPYTRETFNPTVSGGPGSDLGWTWTKGVKSKQLFDQEQNQLAQDALQQYGLNLDAWKDALDVAKYTEEQRKQDEQNQLALTNQQLSAQGLVPSASVNDISAQLNANGAMWKAANDAGNTELANKYHMANEALREEAGWGSGGADGSLTAKYTTAAGTPNANTIAAQQETLRANAKLRMSIPGHEATTEDAAILGIPEGTVLTPVKVSGSRGGNSSVSRTDLVNGIRKGATDLARENLSKYAWNNGEGAVKAAQTTVERLWMPNADGSPGPAPYLSGSEYTDVVNQIYRSVGLNPPNLAPEKAES